MSFNKYEGSVSNIREVTRNRVQFQLNQNSELLELFISQSWVLNEGDRIVAYGKRDKTGKVCCHAYKNMDLNVIGWKESSIIDLLGLVVRNFMLWLPILGVLAMINHLSDKWTFIWSMLFVTNVYVFYKLYVVEYIALKKLSKTVCQLT